MEDFGGVSGSMQTPFNTLGIGDPVPYGMGHAGSGDIFGNGKKKKKAQIATKPGPQVSLGVNFEQKPLIVYTK